MKKIIVSPELCIGCGACVAIDPEHFEFKDDGFATAIKNDNLDSPSLKEAIESCPTTAISIVEETEGCTCENCNCNPCECPPGECNCQ